MDPNLFHLDWERTFEVLALIAILAFVVERALAVIFENRLFIEHFDRPGVKELVALGVSVGVCAAWKLDAVSMFILTMDHTTVPGYFLTGAVIAGGSKASIKLFHDVIGAKSSAFDQRHDIHAQKAAREVDEAAAKVSPNATPAAIDKVKREIEKKITLVETAAVSGSVVATEALERARKTLATFAPAHLMKHDSSAPAPAPQAPHAAPTGTPGARK